jgi:hypothetical protein
LAIRADPVNGKAASDGGQLAARSMRRPREIKRHAPLTIAERLRQEVFAVNVMLEAALAYGRMGWRIFPCHSIIRRSDGYLVCSCERDCKSPGKHPRTKRGLLEATDDEATIRRWWARWSDANIALATGSGLAVFDIDGAAGEQEFRQLVAQHGPVLATLAARTGRGVHLVYSTRSGAGEVRSSARGNVHVRGEGGYIIVEPSSHISGQKYQWVKKVAIAPLPDWLRQWSQGYEVSIPPQNNTFKALGPLPAHLQIRQSAQPDVAKSAADALRPVWTAAEQARLISALTAIPVKACGYDEFLKIGFALHSLDWNRSDGTSVGFEIWDQWCAQSEHHNQAGLESKWRSFDRSARGEVSVASIYHMARLAGWNGGAPGIPQMSAPPASADRIPSGTPHLNGHANGAQVLPVAFGGLAPIIFPDVNEQNLPRATCTNAGVAVTALGIECRKDLFHEKMMVGGHVINQWAGDLSDEAIQMIRKLIRHRFGFDPKTENTRDACVQLCLEHQFDPVLDYLAGLRWDGTPRLDNWLQRYMGAPDTELNRIIGRLTLIACVRRARMPGTKFDQIVVFESVEGRGKSSAIEILAGKQNFSDQNILGLRGQEQQEAMAGIWLYEIADLTGMKKAEIEHVKAFASRKVDRARPAYGRFRIDRERRTVFFATTNPDFDGYLKSQTGNRRFWPVVIGNVDLDSLARDRDQLWAEAAAREATGESISLPARLWAAAGEEQSQRTENDEWSAAIHAYVNSPDKPHFDVTITDVLADNPLLRIEAARIGRAEQMRAGAVLRHMGMTRYRRRLAGNAFEWRYRKADNGGQTTD